MIDWRAILTVPPSTQFTQNPQNDSSAHYIEDSEDFEYREIASDEAPHASGASVSNTEVAVQNSLPPDPPASPLPPYSYVTYTDHQGRLRGGWEERATCTVRQCHGVGASCRVELSNGDMISLQAVRAVGQLNAEGRFIRAWEVRRHGLDGMRSK